MLFTGTGVLFVSKVVVFGNIFKWNRWRKKEENEQSYYWYLLITFSLDIGKCRHVPYFDSSRPQTESTGVTCCERKDPPHHTSFHVLSIGETF